MLAKQSPQMAFTALNHYLDRDWLHEAFHRTRKDGAVGVDGQTWADYAENLEENLQSLLDRHTRRWKASGRRRCRPVADGFWRWISESFSTLWITVICERF
jgi:RNA-directed DNA polymerase